MNKNNKNVSIHTMIEESFDYTFVNVPSNIDFAINTTESSIRDFVKKTEMKNILSLIKKPDFEKNEYQDEDFFKTGITNLLTELKKNKIVEKKKIKEKRINPTFQHYSDLLNKDNWGWDNSYNLIYSSNPEFMAKQMNGLIRIRKEKEEIIKILQTTPKEIETSTIKYKLNQEIFDYLMKIKESLEYSQEIMTPLKKTDIYKDYKPYRSVRELWIKPKDYEVKKISFRNDDYIGFKAGGIYSDEYSFIKPKAFPKKIKSMKSDTSKELEGVLKLIRKQELIPIKTAGFIYDNDYNQTLFISDKKEDISIKIPIILWQIVENKTDVKNFYISKGDLNTYIIGTDESDKIVFINKPLDKNSFGDRKKYEGWIGVNSEWV